MIPTVESGSDSFGEKGRTLLKAKDFSFTWKEEEHRALSQVNLRLDPAEILLCTGGSGSGKTSLALALCGLIPHRTGGRIGGQILIDGIDTRVSNPLEISRTVGISFQQPQEQFFTLSLEEEVAFSLEQRAMDPSEIHSRVKEALDFTGLKGMEEARPQDLSGGEMQRASLAILLARKPDIYLLDEPFAALDPQGREDILKLLLRIRKEQKASILIFSKNPLPLLKAVDRGLILEKGALVAQGDKSDWFPFIESLKHSKLPMNQLFHLGEILKSDQALKEPLWDRKRAEEVLFGAES